LISIGCFLTSAHKRRNCSTCHLEFPAVESYHDSKREVDMAQLIVRNLEEAVKRKLKRRADRNGHSMEEEIRAILRDAVKEEGRARKGLGTEIVELFKGIGLDEPIQELRGYTIKPAMFDDDE
jgi:antitoxin FitA